jgi:hypothetical protein
MSIKTALKRSIHTMSDFVSQFNLRFEEQSAKPSQGSAPPKLTVPAEKVRHETRASDTGALQNGTTRNGQAHATQAQPPRWNARPFSAVLGTNTHSQTVSISEEAWRQFLVLFGATGTGKTTILRHLIRQVMQAGHGLLLLEPHSDLTKQVIADVPKDQVKDVVLLDLMDAGEFPFGLSLFECDNPSNIAEVAKTASMVQHVLEKTWDVGPHTPVLVQVARHITYTMVETGLTLYELQLLLWDDAIRAKLTATLKNTQTRLFWQQYNAKSPRERAEYTDSVWNKLDSYLSHPLLANILCQQHSTINLRHIMDSGQILLVLLSPQLEEFSRLIGTILLSKLLFAAFSRAGSPEESRRPFYVFADEWHRFASSDVASFIAEARKFRVVIGALATQSLEQLDDACRAAALQTGSLMAFRVSGEDSKVLAKNFDATPGMEQIGVEPLRSPVADVIAHLVHKGHQDPRVAKFAQTHLANLERYLRKPAVLHEPRYPAFYNCFDGRISLPPLHVLKGREFLNDHLHDAMTKKRSDLQLSSLALYILAVSQEDGREFVLSNWVTKSFDDFKAFKPGFEQFGRSSFTSPVTSQAYLSQIAKRWKKRHFWMAEAWVELLKELRYCLEVLAKEDPILVDTGKYIPQYRQRTYQDQENLIANDLSQLPNYQARVRLLTGEHTIMTRPAPALLSETEIDERIQAIKQRMLLTGICKPYTAVEAEIRKRHTLLRERADADVPPPPPSHSNGRRNGRGKPLPSHR